VVQEGEEALPSSGIFSVGPHAHYAYFHMTAIFNLCCMLTCLIVIKMININMSGCVNKAEHIADIYIQNVCLLRDIAANKVVTLLLTDI